MKSSRIRIATRRDAAKLLEIYAPYVEKTAVTFEYEVPAVTEFEKRIDHILGKYPYLVAERAGDISGYAYAGVFKDRAAYRWAVETTVYVREDMKKMGTGRELYAALEKILSMQNILNLNACIAYPCEAEDPYLTRDSVQFHKRLGYQFAGKFHRCGYKFGRWYHDLDGEVSWRPYGKSARSEIFWRGKEPCRGETRNLVKGGSWAHSETENISESITCRMFRHAATRGFFVAKLV